MPAEREKSTNALREQRRDETDKVAAELIDADLKAKREKTERLRLARLAAQATGPGKL